MTTMTPTTFTEQQKQRLHQALNVYVSAMRSEESARQTAINMYKTWAANNGFSLAELQIVEAMYDRFAQRERANVAANTALQPQPATAPQRPAATEIQPIPEHEALAVMAPENIVASGTRINSTLIAPNLLELGEKICRIINRCPGIKAKFRCADVTQGVRVDELHLVQDFQSETEEIVLPQKLESTISAITLYGGMSAGKNPVLRLRSGYIGLEIPKSNWNPISVKMAADRQRHSTGKEPLIIELGRDTLNKPVSINLSRRVSTNALIGGMTGSGKNGVFDTILYQSFLNFMPQHLQVVLIDPQEVNFQYYEGLPWLYQKAGIISSGDRVVEMLKTISEDCRRRKDLFKAVRASEINEYNQVAGVPLPHYLFVIDEASAVREEVAGSEDVDQYDLDLARASKELGKFGLHILIGDQRAACDNQTGSFHPSLRANLGNRICLKTADAANSKLILGDEFKMAYLLEGAGDAYLRTPDYPECVRFQGYFTPHVLIEKTAELWRNPEFLQRCGTW